MPLKIATVKSQEAMVTTVAGEDTEDLRFGYNVHALHLDIYSLKDEATAATIQDLYDKVTRIEISSSNGTPEIAVDSDDLRDFSVTQGFLPYHSILTSTDNIPHSCALPYNLSPFPEDPLKNFGAPPGSLIQYKLIEIADVNQDFDTYTYDLTVDGVDASDKPNSVGYVRMVQDPYTSGAVNEIRKTDIGPAKRILGAMNFQTTSYDDLAASAAVDVTGIRFQRLAFSDSVAFEYRPLRAGSFKWYQDVASFAAAAAVINVLDNGRFFADYGIRNQGSVLGVAYQREAKIQTIAGVAEITRVIPVCLV